MLNNAWTIFRVNASLRGNKLIYWLGRIPLIRRLFTDRLYAAGEGKMALFVLQNLWWVLKAIAGKVLYLAALLLIAAWLALDGTQDALSPANLGPFLWLFLWFSFLVGTLLQPYSVTPSQMKYICVRMMAMNAKRYQMITGLGHHMAAFAGFTPLLMIVTALLGTGAWAGLAISVELAFVRLAAGGLHLVLYSRTGVSIGHKLWYIILLVVVGMAGAFACLLALPQARPQDLLLHPAAAVVLAVLGILGAVYMVRFPNYYRLVLDTCKAEAVSPELAKQKASGTQFKDVQLKDSDLTAEGDSRLTGWPYLQALFFRRHRRMLYKPLKIVLAILAGATVVGAALLLFFRGEETAEVFDLVPLSLPYCVFFLYFMDNNVGTRICKAMFYNCDLAMLKYPWYRQGDVVLKNFLLRFTRLCGVNLAVSGAVCVMFTVLTLCAGGQPPLGEYLVFLAAILCLGVFFAVHCLGMYYLFQPYTSDLQVKNPFFSGINLAVYIACYACIQIRSTPSWFALLVLGVTVVYSAVILTLVYRRAPQTFRVK